MADPTPMSEADRRRQRRRDVWQLHVPLVLVLLLCTVLTIVEARRAGDGVWRAWAYMFEWPLIGLFALWIWNRYRTHGSVTRGLADRWRAHVAQYGVNLDEEDPGTDPASPPALAPLDPDLQAWQGYVEDLHRRDPPGQPPTAG